MIDTWTPSAKFCAQSAHYLAGALVILTADEHGLSLFWTAISHLPAAILVTVAYYLIATGLDMLS